MNATIHHGNCLDVLREMPDNSVDAVICDPPYGLSNTTPGHVAETVREWATGNTEYVPAVKGGFMGAAWDSFVPPPAVWIECFRVLKPGGHMAVFAGTRTLGIMDISVRLAGFDHRDTIGAGLMAWVSGQGFPKSQNIAKKTGDPAHEGLGTSLKPSWEPILLYRKPLSEKTVAANVQEHGTGAINIDATRIRTRDKLVRPDISRDDNAVFGKGLGSGAQSEPQGRFPANVVLDENAAHELDKQSGTLRPGERPAAKGITSTPGANGTMGGGWAGSKQEKREVLDSGGASRFFKVVEADTPFKYCAKAPKKERPTVKRTVLRLRDDLTPEQVDHVRARLQEDGISPE